MCRSLPIIILLFVCEIASAQKADSTVYFFDEDGEKTIYPEEAFAYRIAVPKGDLVYIRDFLAETDQPMHEGTYRRRGLTMERHGTYKSWYPNGRVEEEGSYENDRKIGLWKMYYSTGQQADEQFIHGSQVKYHQHWDKDGNPQIVAGNGKFAFGAQYLEVIDSMLFAAFKVDSVSGDSIYYTVPENAAYVGGMDKFYKDVEKDLKYPKLARQYFVEGLVYVEFRIDKAGKLHQLKIRQGIGGGCDEAALKAMEKRTSWTPGRVRGKPVIQMMALPIAFNLKKPY
jgi:TonB family protein